MKKVLSLLLILVLTAGVMTVPVFAVEIGTLEEKGSLSLKVGEGDVYPGGTVEVTVSLANNPGVAGVKFELAYNTDVFTLRGVKSEDIPNGSESLVDGYLEIGPNGIIWANGENLVEDTNLIKLIFDVSKSAETGDYTIGFAADSVSGGHATETDGVKHELYVEFDLGNAATVSITEREYALGDVDKSGTVDILDVQSLYSMVSSNTTDKLDFNLANVNSDNSIDILDVQTLYSMVSGS